MGGLAFIVDFTTLFTLTSILNVYYLLSAALAFILGLIVNYTISIRWVFYSSKKGSALFQFSIFLITGLIGLGLNEISMYFFTAIVHQRYLISKLLATIIVFFWNFFSRKQFLLIERRKAWRQKKQSLSEQVRQV